MKVRSPTDGRHDGVLLPHHVPWHDGDYYYPDMMGDYYITAYPNMMKDYYLTTYLGKIWGYYLTACSKYFENFQNR